MKLEYSGQIFEKASNIKLHENSCSGTQRVGCARTDAHYETVAFRSSVKALESAVHASVRQGLAGVFHVPQRTVLRILHENGTCSVTPNHSTFSISNLVTTPQAGNF